MAGRKEIPKKLEDELENVKYYKPSAGSEKTKSISAVFDDSVERAMYDEILGPLVNRKSSIPSTKLDNAKQMDSSTKSSGMDFNASVLTRLQALEVENKEVRRKLAEQIMYNEKLEKEVIDLKCLVNDPSELADELKYVRSKNKALQDKIREMEQFLADYGLEWIGNSNAACEDEVEVGEESPNDIAFSDFLKHIQELNAIVYSDPAQVITEGSNSRKARLVQASELVENIKITFYKNGLMIRRGPFRESNSESYATFMNDILDGYFPSEFKKEFPDGVTFDVIDKHSVEYVEGKTDEDSRISAAQLLNRLPKTIIRKGEVIDIRNDLENRISGGGTAASGGVNKILEEVKSHGGTSSNGKVSSMVTIATPALLASGKSEGIAVEGGKIAQIQVKFVDKGVAQSLLAHMFESDTIENLRFELTKHLRASSPTVNRNEEAKNDAKGTSNDAGSDFNIELRSAYPPRVLSDSMTLKEAGLLPNGTVHAKRI